MSPPPSLRNSGTCSEPSSIAPSTMARRQGPAPRGMVARAWQTETCFPNIQKIRWFLGHVRCETCYWSWIVRHFCYLWTIAMQFFVSGSGNSAVFDWLQPLPPTDQLPPSGSSVISTAARCRFKTSTSTSARWSMDSRRRPRCWCPGAQLKTSPVMPAAAHGRYFPVDLGGTTS